jgi:hypothetical protein
MADFFSRLWNNHIVTLFKDSYIPRSMARHEIICDIFYNAFDHGSRTHYQGNKNIPKVDAKCEELENYFLTTKYYFERVIVEIAITLARNKGIIEPREALKDERIGRFYGLYKRKFIDDQDAARNKNQTLKEHLKTDLPYCLALFSLNKIYQDCFKLEGKYSFSNNLLNLGRFSPQKDNWRYDDILILNDIQDNLHQGNKTDKAFLTEISEFLNKPENEHILIIYRVLKYSPLAKNTVFSMIRRKRKTNEQFKIHFFKRLCANMDKIRKGFTYDITPKFLDEGLSYFESVKRKHVMHTNLSLTYHFANTLHSLADWDTLLIISERGKFMANHLENRDNGQGHNDINDLLRRKQVIIVACHEAVAEYLNQENVSTLELADKYKEHHGLQNANVKIHFLPYWRHHHHMAIFLRKDETPDRNNENEAIFPIDDTTSMKVVKSIYYFKQGFSNKINPLLIPNIPEDETTYQSVKNDQSLLLDTFMAQYFKSRVYELDNSFLPVINPDLSFTTTIKGETLNFSKEIFFKSLK